MSGHLRIAREWVTQTTCTVESPWFISITKYLPDGSKVVTMGNDPNPFPRMLRFRRRRR